MTSVLEPGLIGNLKLTNRLIRSATWEGMCDPEGRPTRKLTDYYVERVKGGIGLIISGYTFVRPDGRQMPGQMGLHTDAFADGFKALTRAVHDAGGRIAVQVAHAGGQTDAKTAGRTPVAPSAVRFPSFPGIPQALTILEIEDLTDAFAAAARRARDWGFDAVQIHGAHGYLVNQFLSPLTNLRTDEYGGSLENRSRFLLDIYEKMRTQAGPHYPIMIKLSGDDHMEGGFTALEAVAVAERLSQEGMNAIEVSSGSGASGEKSPIRKKILSTETEAYNLDLALAVKAGVSCPVIGVGGFRSLAVAQKALDQGLDFIALSRPLVREPDLPVKWMNRETDKAGCISCNKCFIPAMTRGGIYCMALKKKDSQDA